MHDRLDPVPFHVTQLVLLLIVATLLGLVARQLVGSMAAVAVATLFAVHTANTETMNFLSSRSELLSAVGFLGALLLFARGHRKLALLPLLIGAMAKAPVVIFALVALAWVRLIEKRPWREALLAAIPSLVAGAIALVALNRMNAPEWTSGGGSAYHYAITQPFVWLHYARLSILPIGLTADTDLQAFRHWYETPAVAGYLFVALLGWAIAKARPAIAFGLAFFAITLLPTSLFPLAEVANEHRLFFPLMGFAIAAVALLAQDRRGMAVVMVAIIAFAIGTHERNRVWATGETLWKDVTEKSPNNGRAWMNYGLTQMEKGDLAGAKAMFERSAQLNPNYSTLEINRGIVTAALGDDDAAKRHFERALALSADRSSHFYYARWLLGRGRGVEALSHLQTAATMAPSWIAPRQLLDSVSIATGERPPSSACRGYEQCFNEGWAATNAGRHLDAAILYRAALRHERRPDALNNLGWSLQSLGFREAAIAAYREALEIDPTFERAANNLRSIG